MTIRLQAIALALLLLLALPATADVSPLTAGDLLPNTDGYGLLPKPPKGDEATARARGAEARAACDSGCATPYGTLLGTADGTPARSNCRSLCLKPAYSFLDPASGELSVHEGKPANEALQFTGVTYQCVNYARKWWMKVRGIAFPSIDSAHEILYLETARRIRDDAVVPLGRSLNGTARRPPQRGDLLIWYPAPDVPKWRHGHVAVVVDVDLRGGSVAVAEENYFNAPWEDPEAYARRLQLFRIGDRYQLVDVAPGQVTQAHGARISGWVYPLQHAQETDTTGTTSQ